MEQCTDLMHTLMMYDREASVASASHHLYSSHANPSSVTPLFRHTRNCRRPTSPGPCSPRGNDPAVLCCSSSRFFNCSGLFASSHTRHIWSPVSCHPPPPRHLSLSSTSTIASGDLLQDYSSCLPHSMSQSLSLACSLRYYQQHTSPLRSLANYTQGSSNSLWSKWQVCNRLSPPHLTGLTL